MNGFALVLLLLINLLLTTCPINAIGQIKFEKTYYPAHKIRSISYLRKNKLLKVIMFCINGKTMSEANFDSTEHLFGKQISYYENGIKKKENFVIGIESIPYGLFSDTADIDDKFVDVITCKTINYYENGKIKSKGYIVNGMRIGYWSFYDKDGIKSETKFYKCLSKEN